MEILKKVDERCLSVFERVAGASQRNIGLDCFFWGSTAIFAALVLISMKIGLFVKIEMAYSFLVFVFVFLGLWISVLNIFIKKQVYDDLEKGFSNVLKQEWLFARFACMAGQLSFLFLFAVVYGTGFHMKNEVGLIFFLFTICLCIFIACYFYSCDPLPPSKTRNKIGEWLIRRRLVVERLS